MYGVLLVAANFLVADPDPPVTFRQYLPNLPWLRTPAQATMRVRAEQLAAFVDLFTGRLQAGQLEQAHLFNYLQVQRDFEDAVCQVNRNSSRGAAARYREHMQLLDTLEHVATAKIADGSWKPGALEMIAAQRELLEKHFAKLIPRA